jgi:hypothetical protein
MIRPPELSSNPANRDILKQIRRNLAKEIMNLAFGLSLFILLSDFVHAV